MGMQMQVGGYACWRRSSSARQSLVSRPRVPVHTKQSGMGSSCWPACFLNHACPSILVSACGDRDDASLWSSLSISDSLLAVRKTSIETRESLSENPGLPQSRS